MKFTHICLNVWEITIPISAVYKILFERTINNTDKISDG